MKNKKIIALILSLSMLMAFTSCSRVPDTTTAVTSTENTTTEATTETSEETSEETEESSAETTEGTYVIRENSIPDAYMDIINKTNEIIDQAIEGADYFSEEDGYMGVSEEAYYLGADAKDNICFSIADINGDGVDELIISSRVHNEDTVEYDAPVYRAGYSVLSVYTLSNDEATLVVEAWARNSWFINADGKFINEGSSGAANHEIGIYTFEEGATELTNTYRLYSDYNAETNDVSLYEESGDSITVVDAEDLWDVFDSTRENLTADMFELELVPINSALV